MLSPVEKGDPLSSEMVAWGNAPKLSPADKFKFRQSGKAIWISLPANYKGKEKFLQARSPHDVDVAPQIDPQALPIRHVMAEDLAPTTTHLTGARVSCTLYPSSFMLCLDTSYRTCASCSTIGSLSLWSKPLTGQLGHSSRRCLLHPRQWF